MGFHPRKLLPLTPLHPLLPLPHLSTFLLHTQPNITFSIKPYVITSSKAPQPFIWILQQFSLFAPTWAEIYVSYCPWWGRAPEVRNHTSVNWESQCNWVPYTLGIQQQSSYWTCEWAVQDRTLASSCAGSAQQGTSEISVLCGKHKLNVLSNFIKW